MPGLIYSALTVVLTVLVAGLALSISQPPPPNIAEFAPQAMEQIRDSLDEQASRLGGGAGRGAEGGSDAQVQNPDGVVSEPIEVARVRTCVGDPPRQIEDPKSPPCVPYWEGDNGGSTWKGVGSTEIRVAWPVWIEGPENSTQILTAFFNRRFEFYGRKLVLIPFEPGGGFFGAGSDPSTTQSDAVKADEELQVFASLGYPYGQGANFRYYDELARRQIVSVDSWWNLRTERDHYQRFDPYQWGFSPSHDKIQRNMAEWACKLLVHRPPVFASGQEAVADERVFGVIVVRTPDGTVPDVSLLRSGLSACGSDVAKIVEYKFGGATEARSVVLDLQSAGVTSVTCFCNFQDMNPNITQAATSQGYFPEWLVGGYQQTDDDSIQFMPPEQRRALIGISFHDKWLPLEDMPFWWATREVDPTVSADAYREHRNAYKYVYLRYQNLLLLASGIQLAGPKLTPTAFRNGLMRTVFPNPGAGEAPLWQSRVEFGPGNHTMPQDASMVWFSESDHSYQNPGTRGTLCSAERGRRWSLGSWPEGDPRDFYFGQPCR